MSISRELLGERVWNHRLAQRVRALPVTARVALAASLLGALVFLPYAGAVGLWDPWESHYGEVAREMIDRHDYVYPYWESSWFFSKPPLTMWMDMIGMQLVGTNRTPGKLALYTEWGIRTPFVLISIAALALMAVAMARVVNRRTGLAFAVIFATMPLQFLITRQAVTDVPFVATLIAAMACALIGLFDERTRHRTGWWMAFYVLCGLSALAKGLLGVGLPAVILLVYALFCVFPWDAAGRSAHFRWLTQPSARRDVREGRAPMPVLFEQMVRMRLGTGILVFLAVAAPWFVALCLFDQADNEGKLFWYRFFIHDHLNRLVEGVHTTTPGGTFAYFVEQGGYAIFPWVALLPGALAVASRIRLRAQDPRSRVAFIAVIWTLFTFYLMDASATKFHHYVYPVLPGVAILIALFVDRLWEEGVVSNAVPLLIGFVLFALVAKDLATTPKDFTDLFVYNYDRPYPHDLDTRMIAFAGRSLAVGDLLAVALIAVAAYLFVGAAGHAQPRTSERFPSLILGALGVTALLTTTFRGLASPLVVLGIGVGLVAAVALWSASRTAGEGRRRLLGWTFCFAAIGVALVVLGLLRLPAESLLLANLRQPMNVKMVLAWTFTLAGTVFALAALRQSRVALFSSFGALALGFALWFSWSHWVDLSHHWTQRDLFWRYYDRRKPGEPILAYMMDWKGETFYSKNTVRQDKDSPARLAEYANLPGRKWALVEHNRLGILRQAVGSHAVTVVDRDLNVKFVLVTID